MLPPSPVPAAASPEAPPRFYHPELDGLRFLAFLFVFLRHAAPRLELPGWPLAGQLWSHFCDSGALGLDLFFCLSSFLITRLLLLETERHGAIDLARFYLRRLLRIWPLYFAGLALAALLARNGWEAPFGRHLGPFLLLAGNWSSGLWGFPASSLALLWSVSLEEQFYLLWPPALRRLGAGRVLGAAAFLVLLAIACRLGVVAIGLPHPATWCLTVTRLDSLAAGMAAAALLRDDRPPGPAWRRLLLFGGGLVAWILVHWLWPVGSAPSVGEALVFYPGAAAGALAMLAAVYRPEGAPAGLAGAPPLVFLGRISYGLYVFHMAALVAVLRFFPALRPASWGQAAAGFLLTVIAATLSYYLLERPFLTLKERFATIRSRPA